MLPENPGPGLSPHPTHNSPSKGEEKRFSGKDSCSLRMDSHRLPSRWPQPGCAPSRQLLVKVFKQCRSPLVALKAAEAKVLPPRGRAPDGRGMSCPAPRAQAPAPGPEGVERGCPLPWQEDWLGGPRDALLAKHRPLPPLLSLLLEPRVGSCLSRGRGHTSAAEIHLLGPAGDTFLARRRDIWSAREVPSPSPEPQPALNSASNLKAAGEA